MTAESIISVSEIRKLFTAGKPGIFNKKEAFVHAVDGVSFELGKGEVLALAGESGCGKSTLALTIMGLEHPTSGQIWFEGKDVTGIKGRELKEYRRNIQMVFQDPYESLNPLMTIEQLVAEPLEVHKMCNEPGQRRERVVRALEDAGLKPAETYLQRLPHELSGGQRQRVVIAGALVLEPKVLLADEPVSMLDVSIRAEILNLLMDLSLTRGISILIITHDLATSAYLADRVAVMYLGRIVEIGSTKEVLDHPVHPYTQALLSVIPVPNPRARKERIILQGVPPNPIDIPAGCRFAPRCPKVFDRCRVVDPVLEETRPEHQAACLLVEEKKKDAGI